MSLESALKRYPVQKLMNDGLTVEIRPLQQDDRDLIKAFYPEVPEHERMFIKHPVTDMSILDTWCDEIDYTWNLPLLVIHQGKIVGEGTLHRRNGGWKQHIGLISVLTHPDYRGRGISELLVQELIQVGLQVGLKRLQAEFNGERDVAINNFVEAGFSVLLRLPDYLEDMQANSHDYVLLGLDLSTIED